MSLNQRSHCHQTHTHPTRLELALETASKIELGTAEKLRRTQEELRQYRMLYENLPSVYFNLDTTGLILSVNQFGANSLGYTPEQLIQQPIFKLFSQPDLQKLSEAFISLLQTKSENALHCGGLVLESPTHQAKCVKVILRLILDSEQYSDKKTTILMVCEDITPAKLVEQVPETKQSQLAAIESLTQLKDEFLGTVSHELRTPLTNMKMAIQMLGIALDREQNFLSEMTKPAGDRLKSACYFEILDHECDREINLINNFLDLQRLDTNAQPWVLETIHLQQWLWRIVEQFKTRNFHICQQQLQINLDPSLPPLTSNPFSLERILIELLTNACKFSPPGAVITIAAQHKSPDILFQVINTGVEIPTLELPRIFDKFYRIPSNDPWKQGGTGLGLALVQKLIEQLGGTIKVESESNRTCFTIQLALNGK
ncbi:ATP-binding protein [Nostoc sp. TCL26-01]|uniref:PAS domain-containing sensor histidine kinase n=1 Tax=Nostoc sp. TCL26-01 TaxID=2576904 RepID=UPI0015BA6113|nr:ATP-binding protein [Nostoc sp. TCL26-01]QLE59124.1 PAS domain-containing sensor histidine kinase [Nostoc sp. TCL26-01]